VEFSPLSGEIVFDPFLGSGSTLMDLHALERNGRLDELLTSFAQ
jgi:hypothetical protein